VWLTRLRGGDIAGIQVWPALTVAECASLADRMHAEFEQLIDELPADLGGTITYRTFAGDEFTSSVRDVLTHVAIHGAYHRGQVAKLLRTAGLTPMNTDFITFTRETN
jgi:uncharacterized damage-inducible protein DinB